MTDDDPKADLLRYLRIAREALLWKLDGLGEYDVRRPLTPTGTNLLGIVKHVASVQVGYLGETFGRPFPEPLPWLDEGAAPNADMYASAEESRSQLVGLFERTSAHCDATVEALPLDAAGEVPWWPAERRQVRLHRIIVHVLAEINRHTGQADIVRELIDGAAGFRADSDNLPGHDPVWWQDYYDRVEQAARAASAT
jgi:uncharacterized damage-inducible protein DinB